MPKKLVSTGTLNTPSTVTSATLQPSPQIPATFTDGHPLPRLLVFDLDYTLWPFWVDTHVSPPLKPTNKDATKNTAMMDAYGEILTFYREVPGILYAARAKGISMGLASRTHTPDLAATMLKNIVIPPPPPPSKRRGSHASAIDPQDGLDEKYVEEEQPVRAWDVFAYREIYPGSKTTHFSHIHTQTKKKEKNGIINYEDMIFFDDEARNREVERKYGVTFVLVRDGVTTDVVDTGIKEWRKRRGFNRPTEQDGESPSDEA